MTNTNDDLWVFAYGSLMWKPGFEHEECLRATLRGFTRRFCLDSITYRGTPEFPGLVLALDDEPDGACEGVAYRVAAKRREDVHQYLRDRELVTYSYLERFLPIEIADGRRAAALAYVMDRSHQQYRGGLSPEDQAAVIAKARGPAGGNAEYLENTITHLAELGVEDEELMRLHRLVRTLIETV
ncbi:MAG: gamma-glutamylcyclotransferase [Pseudomonadota bacterium]